LEDKKQEVKGGILIVFLVFLVTTTGIMLFMLSGDTIYRGVRIENVDVGSLTKNEARSLLKEKLQNAIDEKKIELKYNDESWVISGIDIEYGYDYDGAIKRAYELGREGNPFKRIEKIIGLYKNKEDVDLETTYNNEKLSNILIHIEKNINKDPVDASMHREKGQFIIVGEKLAFQLDREETEKVINDKLKENSNNMVIPLVIKTVNPRITKEDLGQIKDLIGYYVTRFNRGKVQRSSNIKRAGISINGIILMPNDEFSFNDSVGPRTIERGYKPAPVILNGELIEGIGGGICQVSSTLYNAVLMSGLEIIERYNHSIPSTYVGKGRDATVSYGVLDFKFRNNLAYPIYIESYTSRNQMIVRIYGKKTDNSITKIKTHLDEIQNMPVETKYDNNLIQGTEKIEKKGRNGYKISTYRIIYKDGKIIKNERISKDYYRPSKQIIIKGTKVVSNEEHKEVDNEGVDPEQTIQN
jgi:vancomycin resistance protein YoaR